MSKGIVYKVMGRMKDMQQQLVKHLGGRVPLPPRCMTRRGRRGVDARVQGHGTVGRGCHLWEKNVAWTTCNAVGRLSCCHLTVLPPPVSHSASRGQSQMGAEDNGPRRPVSGSQCTEWRKENMQSFACSALQQPRPSMSQIQGHMKSR